VQGGDLSSEHDIPARSELLDHSLDLPGCLQSGEPNIDVLLARDEPAYFILGEARVEAAATVEPRMLPRARAVVSAAIPGTMSLPFQMEPLPVEMPRLQLAGLVSIEHESHVFNPDPSCTLSGWVSSITSPPSEAEVVAVEFGIVNLGELSSRISSGRRAKERGRDRWQAGEWEIELASNPGGSGS
jgi:hypothetical protein